MLAYWWKFVGLMLARGAGSLAFFLCNEAAERAGAIMLFGIAQ
jgi:hypothetical protein